MSLQLTTSLPPKLVAVTKNPDGSFTVDDSVLQRTLLNMYQQLALAINNQDQSAAITAMKQQIAALDTKVGL